MKIGVVGTSGGWSSEKLADAAANKTGYRLLIDLNRVAINLTTGKARYEDIDLTELDALIIKKVGARYSPDLLDRLEMLRFLYERGLPMFSSPLRIMRVLDRLSCTVTLRSGGIPMPDTTITEDVDEGVRAVEEYGQAVFKPLYTSKAKGMIMLENGPGIKEKIEEYKQDNTILYIQKRIDHQGKDLGIVFMGGEYMTTYARKNTAGDTWNTTTRNGGKYEGFDPPVEIVTLARQAQDLFGLDFTCVDVALTSQGPYVFEVSAFGGFRGIQTAASMDAAALYVDYVLKRLSK